MPGTGQRGAEGTVAVWAGVSPPTPQCSDTGTHTRAEPLHGGTGVPGLTTPCDSPSPEPLRATWGRRAKPAAKPRCQPADGDARTTGVPGRSARFDIPLKHEQVTEVRRGAAEEGGAATGSCPTSIPRHHTDPARPDLGGMR